MEASVSQCYFYKEGDQRVVRPTTRVPTKLLWVLKLEENTARHRVLPLTEGARDALNPVHIVLGLLTFSLNRFSAFFLNKNEKTGPPTCYGMLFVLCPLEHSARLSFIGLKLGTGLRLLRRHPSVSFY